MFDICGTAVRITKGDTGLIGLVPNTPLPEDTVSVSFTVRPFDSDTPVLVKTCIPDSDGVTRVLLDRTDTETIAPGVYRWGARYSFGNGEVITPFAQERFEVLQPID